MSLVKARTAAKRQINPRVLVVTIRQEHARVHRAQLPNGFWHSQRCPSQTREFVVDGPHEVAKLFAGNPLALNQKGVALQETLEGIAKGIEISTEDDLIIFRATSTYVSNWSQQPTFLEALSKSLGYNSVEEVIEVRDKSKQFT